MQIGAVLIFTQNEYNDLRNLGAHSILSGSTTNYSSQIRSKTMTYSNLSKIKPKLRTSGNVTGNFGKNKVKSGSPLQEIGMSNKEMIKCATPDEYLSRLYYAFDNTTDTKLRKFLYQEIRKIHVQKGTW
jgi:hypothetical protein